MREIKFRAWDGQELLDDICFDTDDFTDMLNKSFAYFQKFEKIVFEQYTGLKDKNGVEIYEGDILSAEIGHLYVVFHYKSEMSTGVALRTKTGSTIDIGFESAISLAVVGNIHENPELLEKDNG